MAKDLVTIRVNRKTFVVLGVLVLYAGSVFGAYKYGYKKGIMTAFRAIEQALSRMQEEHAPAFEPGIGSTR